MTVGGIMLRIAICDEEIYYLEKIKTVILENLSKRGVEDVRLYTFSSGKEFCMQEEVIAGCQIIFLDIQMRGYNGIDIARQIKRKYPNIYIVFVTAHADYALLGYQVEAFRYLIKDMLEETIQECIGAFLAKLEQKAVCMRFTFEEKECSIQVRRIMYIESFRHAMHFHVDGETEILKQPYGTLKDLEELLGAYGFYRVHKSFLVNMYYTKNMKRYQLYLKNGDVIPVPRERFQDVWNMFQYILYEVKRSKDE